MHTNSHNIQHDEKVIKMENIYVLNAQHGDNDNATHPAALLDKVSK